MRNLNKIIIELILNSIKTDREFKKLESISQTLYPNKEYETPCSCLIPAINLLGFDLDDEGDDMVNRLCFQYEDVINSSKGKSDSDIATDVFLDWTNSINKYNISETKTLAILK